MSKNSFITVTSEDTSKPTASVVSTAEAIERISGACNYLKKRFGNPRLKQSVK